MTDDKDRKILSDEEMEDVAGGAQEKQDKLEIAQLQSIAKKPGDPDDDGKVGSRERRR